MELKDTIEMMVSPDYKERFKAEYYQLEIRIEKLANMLTKRDNGELNFTPVCAKETLQEQLKTMVTLISILQIRAKCENIDL